MKNRSISDEVRTLDSVISVCFGRPSGDELPQVAGLDDTVIDVFSDTLDMSYDKASAYYYHQLDGSYEGGYYH